MGGSSLATSRTAGSASDDEHYSNNWVVEGPPPPPTLPYTRIKRTMNAAALSRAVF
jgi:hypothetical protein